ncbi:NAD(P)-binding protein [Peniophora sp. CONT]|nr:NAD(P)-binding protein [Peniophora sp. CONT]
MSLPLANKVALVTGSSRSIGAAIAKHLATLGASVIINYASSSSAAQEVVKSIETDGRGKAAAVQADVSSISGAQTLLDGTLKAFGKLDILVLNAGIMGNATLEQVDEDFYTKHMDANVKGPLFLTKLAAPHLPSGGRVIFFSTSVTRMSAVSAPYLVYAATKGAIEQLSRVLAKDLGARGITVNTVSPGPVDTPLFREGKPPQVIEMIKSFAPLKRLGEPEDIAPLVAFLAGEEARWVNGQNIMANGGFVV